jgi:hypothetical protein
LSAIPSALVARARNHFAQTAADLAAQSFVDPFRQQLLRTLFMNDVEV